MSYVNSTEFYNIPLFEETDLYNPMDYNSAMEAIDTAIHGAVTDAENAVSTAGSASDVATAAAAAVETLSGEVAEANGKITALQTNVLNLDNKVDDIKDDALDMICAFVEPTAQIGDDPQSTHNYSIGDYFRYNDVLYKATAAIHIGDTIVPNTNCVATNVTSELESGTAASQVSLAPITGMSADDVQEGIEELNTSLTWKKLGTYTGSGSHSLPSNFNEILISVETGATANVIIPKLQLSSSSKTFFDCGIANGGQVLSATFNVSDTAIEVYNITWDNNNVTATNPYDVYYR